MIDVSDAAKNGVPRIGRRLLGIGGNERLPASSQANRGLHLSVRSARISWSEPLTVNEPNDNL